MSDSESSEYEEEVEVGSAAEVEASSGDEESSAEEEEGDSSDSDEEEEVVAGDLTLDLGNLAAFSSTAVDNHAFSQNKNEYLKSVSRDGAQKLMNRIFTLPTVASSDMVGRISDLPEPNTHLPREKPVPKPKAPTKWEAFAKSKGILKKKKNRMEFDEEKNEYRASHGYKKANDESTAWAMPHKEGSDPSIDPWTKLAAEKKERMEKNTKKQLKNLKAAHGLRLPGTLDLSSTMSTKLGKRKQVAKAANKEEMPGTGRLMGAKEHVTAAFDLASRSTASMGAFDQLRPGEGKKKKRPKKVLGQASAPKAPINKKSAADLARSFSNEKKQALSVLDRVMGGVASHHDDSFNPTKEVNLASQMPSKADRVENSKKKNGGRGKKNSAKKGKGKRK